MKGGGMESQRNKRNENKGKDQGKPIPEGKEDPT